MMVCIHYSGTKWLKAKKVGQAGTTLIAKVTGLSVETIRRSRAELEDGLVDWLVGRMHKSVKKCQPPIEC